MERLRCRAVLAGRAKCTALPRCGADLKHLVNGQGGGNPQPKCNRKMEWNRKIQKEMHPHFSELVWKASIPTCTLTSPLEASSLEGGFCFVGAALLFLPQGIFAMWWLVSTSLGFALSSAACHFLWLWKDWPEFAFRCLPVCRFAVGTPCLALHRLCPGFL